MEQNEKVYNEYVEYMTDLTVGNKRLAELFAVIPEMSIDSYQKTAFLYANKKYEEELNKDEPIPHGFYQILDDSIIKTGFLPTLRVYEKELKLISDTLQLGDTTLRDILKDLRPRQNKGLNEIQQEQKSRSKLKQIFRKFNSVFKENYIKGIVERKMKLLQDTVIFKDQSTLKRVLKPDSFADSIFNNSVLLSRIKAIISEDFYVYPTDSMVREIIIATTKKNYKDSMCRTLMVQAPESYERYLRERHIRRMEANFIPKLLEASKNYSLEEKQVIVKAIEYKQKCLSTAVSQDSEEYRSLKMLIRKESMVLISGIAKMLNKASGKISIVDGEFSFTFPRRVTPVEIAECESYKNELRSIKKIHNNLYGLYNKQNEVLLEFMNLNKPSLDANEDSIDKSKWLDAERVKKLISLLDINRINNMPKKVFTALKKFLVKDDLLWIYLAGNIQLSVVAKIINNFEAIYSSIDPSKINISNITELVKKANLYDYVDDFTIALIGLDNLSKIINYNQFLGVNVTDEIIRLRIQKVVDLALRAENTYTSSLPFSCDIRTDKYSLLRYRNNDPSIFTSGFDTKTCFSVGVNENDFFFYSLLSKDGYVIKIVNDKNELVARASCFRRNNVLMINGIRFLNNKVIPANQEELQQFKEVVDLVRLMAKKMISITSYDRCPIDYVVCNQAGLLENAWFEGMFEKVNSQLFKEPINVYNEEWEKFVHMYDNEPVQMLQEVPSNPEHSFTTDFGNHYPALLLESRNNMGLFSPRDISLEDQDPTYFRPRRSVREFIGEEINADILASINRIRAHDYARRRKDGEDMGVFSLLSSPDDISTVYLGDDWCFVMLKNGEKLPYYSRINRTIAMESCRFAPEIQAHEKGVKLYLAYDKNSTK